MSGDFVGPLLDIAVDASLRPVAPPREVLRVFSEAMQRVGFRIVEGAPCSLHVSLASDGFFGVNCFVGPIRGVRSLLLVPLQNPLFSVFDSR